MNLIVTGKVQSGKTTWCQNYSSVLSEKGFKTGGILCHTIKMNGSRIGCNVYDQQSGKNTVFARQISLAGYRGEVAGKFLISYEGLTFAEKAIREALDNKCHTVFIDEIGHLELAGKGLMKIARTAHEQAENTVAVVRKSLLIQFIKSFSFTYPQIKFVIRDIETDSEYPL